MAEKSEGWGLWAIIIAAIAGGYYLITPNDAPSVPIPMPPLPVVSEPAIEKTGKPEGQIGSVLPTPTANFDATENRVYFYLGAASEDEKKKGIAAGPTLAFRYYGRNSNNEHVLRSYTSSGYPIKFYYCADPCRLMRDENGERTVLTTGTIMSAVVEDVRNGFLKKSKLQQPPVAEPINEPEVEVEPVIETVEVEPAEI